MVAVCAAQGGSTCDRVLELELGAAVSICTSAFPFHVVLGAEEGANAKRPQARLSAGYM